MDNPLVTGAPNVRLYAGAPIAVGGAAPTGALGVFDDRLRPLNRGQIAALERLRDVLVAYLELDLVAPGSDSAVRLRRSDPSLPA